MQKLGKKIFISKTKKKISKSFRFENKNPEKMQKLRKKKFISKKK